MPANPHEFFRLDCSTAPTALMFEHLEAHDTDLATPPGLLAGSGPGPTRFDTRLKQNFKQRVIAAHPDGIQSKGLRKTRFGGSSCPH